MSAKPPASGRQPWDVYWVESLAPDRRSLTAARELLRSKAFGQVELTASGSEWVAVCRGLTGEYRVRVRQPGLGEFEGDCTCPSQKYPCKHVLALLLHLAQHPDLQPKPAAPVPRPTMDFEALLREVFAAPDDDTVRLVFADCVDDLGQPDRAALIRVQVERARRERTGQGTDDLVKQETGLVAAVLQQVIGALPLGARIGVNRGFLQMVADSEVFGDVSALPGRFLSLFRDGWVEAVKVHGSSWLGSQEGIRLLRYAGQVDLEQIELPDHIVLCVATELPAGTAEGRVSKVGVHPTNLALYRAYRGEQPLPAKGQAIETGILPVHQRGA